MSFFGKAPTPHASAELADARQDYQQAQAQREQAAEGAVNARLHAQEAADAWRGTGATQ